MLQQGFKQDLNFSLGLHDKTPRSGNAFVRRAQRLLEKPEHGGENMIDRR